MTLVGIPLSILATSELAAAFLPHPSHVLAKVDSYDEHMCSQFS
jgi:hypothetical protein